MYAYTGLVLAGLSLMGCGGSNVAATINGKPITVEELDQSFGGRIAQQIYEMRKDALDNIVEQKLIEQAAKEKKLTVEEYFKQEVESKISEPAEEEIKTIYEANADRYGPNFAQVKDSIAGALKRNRVNMQRGNLLAQLREKSKIETKLKKPPVPRVAITADDDPCLGPEKAKVTVIEFSDFQCPFCGRARAAVNQMIETYKSDLRYCFRDFPLSFHPDAFLASVAAQCAFDQGNEKFWDYNKKLFNAQKDLKANSLKQYAKELGLDANAFNQCLDSQKFGAEVQKDLEQGSQAGVSGTPAFFVNGILVSGAQPFANFKEIIDEELKK